MSIGLDNIIQKELKQVCDAKSINSIEALKKEYDKNSNELKLLMEQKVKDIIKNPAMKDIIEETLLLFVGIVNSFFICTLTCLYL